MRFSPEITLLLVYATALAGCATVSPAPVDPPKLAPPAAAVMVPRKADFLERMENFLFDLLPRPTTSPDSSPPAKP